jgi:hypothetical protein
MYYSIYTAINILPGPTPCISKHPLFYFLLFPATFLVVTTTHPPLSLVCKQLSHPLLCPSHLFTPHSSNYIIYTDNISNLSRLRPGLWPYISSPPHGWPSNMQGELYIQSAEEQFPSTQCCCFLVLWNTGTQIIISNFIFLLFLTLAVTMPVFESILI